MDKLNRPRVFAKILSWVPKRHTLLIVPSKVRHVFFKFWQPYCLDQVILSSQITVHIGFEVYWIKYVKRGFRLIDKNQWISICSGVTWLCHFSCGINKAWCRSEWHERIKKFIFYVISCGVQLIPVYMLSNNFSSTTLASLHSYNCEWPWPHP